ncbi:MAG TPA: CopG family transcriptional regulator [Candidatus Hydrogenedentes bacterium]|nr:CopG family transcriptional regulator [Candidatus Hydrogenedentota bacterium]HQH53780.1 CopG family transcriptional regulator [Candidatus Hydrogenedentota bacterium]HQM47937.1 CopG family transcriptional regulator [Candidatus Hydrogenedentota bacterium]
MPPSKKHEIITFKVDEGLSHAMQGIGNRSEFIRRAILAALENVCPLCLGAGALSPEQRKHWDRFSATHNVEECENCHAMHIVCVAAGSSGEAETHAH